MVYLLCGVPGSGKTWVCNQIGEFFRHIPHDFHTHDTLAVVAKDASKRSDKPIVIDCPFNERNLRAKLEAQGLPVTPVFIVEKAEVIRDRYWKRERRVPSPNVLTRAATIMEKVKEWKATYGTSDEVLQFFKRIMTA